MSLRQMSLRQRTLLGIGLATLAVLFLALRPSWLPGGTTTTTTATTTAGEGVPARLQRACDLGDRLLQGNVYDQARTAYIRALEVELRSTTTSVAMQQTASTTISPYECAYAGLRRIPPVASAVAGAPATAAPLAAVPAVPSTTSPPEVGPAAAETVEGLFGALTEFLGRRLALGTAGWLLLLGAVAYLLRRGVVAYLLRFPGPVEVAAFEGPPEAAMPKAPELAALMRQHLADAQLQPPSSLPGSSFEEQLITAIEAAPLVDKTGLGKLRIDPPADPGQQHPRHPYQPGAAVGLGARDQPGQGRVPAIEADVRIQQQLPQLPQRNRAGGQPIADRSPIQHERRRLAHQQRKGPLQHPKRAQLPGSNQELASRQAAGPGTAVRRGRGKREVGRHRAAPFERSEQEPQQATLTLALPQRCPSTTSRPATPLLPGPPARGGAGALLASDRKTLGAPGYPQNCEASLIPAEELAW
jgi:hypothetical protein